ncbi:MAG: ABC transporter substrate-binding protein [Clostridia bacterium]|nr:ABC transporter substrate-binding protein [Clostridia bacterium]
MKFGKILCAFLVIVLVLSGCGGTQTPTDTKLPEKAPVNKKVDKMQLLYSSTDTLNPYTAATELNRQVCQLLFDPLVTVSDSFEPIYRLATSVTLENRQCTVKLKPAMFSDGTAVTADDVVYSANLAKKSQTRYAEQFYEVSSFSAAGKDTVIFNLRQKDPYFVNLLDFPIIKKDSDREKNEDGIVFTPIGCGRYVEEAGKPLLQRKEAYYGKKGTVTTVQLVDAPDADSIAHYVEIGATDVYFTDISDGKIVRMSGKRTEINLNRLVFLGYNARDSVMKSTAVRYAISSALDRKAICRTAYYNNAQPATGLFNPAFVETAPLQNIKNTADLKISVENLAQIGYNSLNGDGYYESKSGKHIVLNLLVNAENESRVAAAELIVEQLKNVGIEVKVVKKSYAAYCKLLEAGSFQMYLGEVHILNNMDLSQLVLPTGSAAYGLRKARETAKEDSKNGSTAQDEAQTEPEKVPVSAAAMINGFYRGEYSMSDVATACLTELPVIPVCYRLGLLFYDDNVLLPRDVAYGDFCRSTATGY